jgi:PAS domain-containing protein
MSAIGPLRAVGTGFAPAGPRVVFCGHCGKAPESGVLPEAGSRVCDRCHLGLLLEAPQAMLPKADEAFLVVDRSLAVCALSRRAERLLGVREVEAVDRHVTDLLVPADAEAQGPHVLSALLVAAATGADDVPAEAVLRPADEFGVRFAARIGPCGPTPGALVVLGNG